MSAPAARRPVFLPGGVADPAGRTGFVAADGGGVDALDLASGRALWRSPEAFLPVVATEDALAAATADGATVWLLLLDARTGARRLASDALGPAAPVWAVDDARLEGGSIRLAWHGSGLPQGTQPDPFSSGGGPFGRGEARVDLATGRVEHLPPAGPEPLPGTDDDDLLPDARLGVRRWAAGGVVAGVALEAGNGAGRLVLRRWSRDTGGALPEVVLADPAPPRAALAHHRFRDPRHVFLRSAVPGAPPRWLVFSAETGAPVADLALSDAAVEGEMAVAGGRLFHLAPGGAAPRPGHRARVLRAVDPATGAALWEHPLASVLATPSNLA